jgi:hypothetical protein
MRSEIASDSFPWWLPDPKGVFFHNDFTRKYTSGRRDRRQ